MNILFVGCSSSWHTAEWINYFARDHRVFLFSDKKDNLPLQKYDSRITIYQSPGVLGWLINQLKLRNHILRRMNKMLSIRLFKKKINNIICDEKIDIVHAHSLYYGYLASFIDSTPIIFTPMGSDVIIHAHKNNYYQKMAVKVFERADAITGDSKLLQKKGFQLGARTYNNYIIQNGVDATKFHPQPSSIKLDLGMKSEDLLIFSPRALDLNYNIDIIVDALALLKEIGIQFKCIFAYAFGGECFDALVSQVERLNLRDYVHWLGFTKHEDMPKYYNAADIVVSIPSSDSSPKSVYEAMFCAKTVIVSDIDWVYEILDDENCVLKVDCRDAASLAHNINAIYQDKEKRSALEQNALKVAANHFDYDLNMMRMQKIMHDLCNQVEIVNE